MNQNEFVVWSNYPEDGQTEDLEFDSVIEALKDIKYPNGIIALVDMGEYGGRHGTYHIVSDQSDLSDALRNLPIRGDSAKFYVDSETGEFCCEVKDRGSVSHAVIRGIKDDIDKEDFLYRMDYGSIDYRKDACHQSTFLDAYTEKLGSKVAFVYGADYSPTPSVDVVAAPGEKDLFSEGKVFVSDIDAGDGGTIDATLGLTCQQEDTVERFGEEKDFLGFKVNWDPYEKDICKAICEHYASSSIEIVSKTETFTLGPGENDDVISAISKECEAMFGMTPQEYVDFQPVHLNVSFSMSDRRTWYDDKITLPVKREDAVQLLEDPPCAGNGYYTQYRTSDDLKSVQAKLFRTLNSIADLQGKHAVSVSKIEPDVKNHPKEWEKTSSEVSVVPDEEVQQPEAEPGSEVRSPYKGEDVSEDDSLEVVNLFNQTALYADYRVDRSTVPEGLYVYELREGDDLGGEPVEIGDRIRVNFLGTVICREPVELDSDGFRDVDPDRDFGFQGLWGNTEELLAGELDDEFLSSYEKERECEWRERNGFGKSGPSGGIAGYVQDHGKTGGKQQGPER